MPHSSAAPAGRPARLRRVGLALLALLACACAGVPVDGSALVLAPLATLPPSEAAAGGSVAVALNAATPGSPAPATTDDGLAATVAAYTVSVGDDPTGAKTAAFITLKDFSNPRGQYSRAWWFADDGYASLADAIAVIFYTEGNTQWDVRTAVAARFLWYCGGQGGACQGAALINYLSYFQPWREPWNAPGFTNESARKYLPLAEELVHQQPGLLTAMIPGADTYARSPDGLSIAGPIDWVHTKFHFANVDSSWDSYLREKLRRLPDGPDRLWVLSMGEASRVCGSLFLCADMTRPRQ